MAYELFCVSNDEVIDTLMNLFSQIDARVKTEQEQLQGLIDSSAYHLSSGIANNKEVLEIPIEESRKKNNAAFETEMSRLRLEYENKLKELERKVAQFENQVVSASTVIFDDSLYGNDQIKMLKEQTVVRMENLISKLIEGPYIIACDETTEVEVRQMEAAMQKGLEYTLRELLHLDISMAKTVGEVQALIQKLLIAEMEPISSWMRKIAIYSAYASIPFMIDDQRTIGVRFDRERVMGAYSQLDDMLASVGIKQIVPAPFVELITDGCYIDATDTATKNIRFLCPDYKKRISRVDRTNVTNMIIDIADVGLVIDGELLRQASVIL